MTAEEAMERAAKAERTGHIEFTKSRPGGETEQAYRLACDARMRVFAAAILKAHVEGLQYAYIKQDWDYLEPRLNECQAALAELEGADA